MSFDQPKMRQYYLDKFMRIVIVMIGAGRDDYIKEDHEKGKKSIFASNEESQKDCCCAPVTVGSIKFSLVYNRSKG